MLRGEVDRGEDGTRLKKSSIKEATIRFIARVVVHHSRTGAAGFVGYACDCGITFEDPWLSRACRYLGS